MLLLDEPSLGLSPLVCKELFQALSRIKDMDVGVLLVEQNARAALAIADRGYLLENGRVVGEGPASRLQDDPAVRQAYLGGSAQGANGHAQTSNGAYRNGHVTGGHDASRPVTSNSGSLRTPTIPSPSREGWRPVEDTPPAWAPGGGTSARSSSRPPPPTPPRKVEGNSVGARGEKFYLLNHQSRDVPGAKP